VNKVLKRWNGMEKFIVGVLAFSATIVSLYGVIMRYLFKSPPDWADEIVIYMVIWAVFIMASTLAEEKGHVAATLLVERFPLKIRRILALFNGLIAFGFCVLIALFGYRIVTQAYLTDERSLTALRFPLWLPYLSVAAGCTLVALRYVLRIYRLIFQFQPSQILESHEMSREDKIS